MNRSGPDGAHDERLEDVWLFPTPRLPDTSSDDFKNRSGVSATSARIAPVRRRAGSLSSRPSIRSFAWQPAFAQNTHRHPIFQVRPEDREQKERQIPSHIQSATVAVPELGGDHDGR
jgi:hypothetical protein